MIHRGVGIRSLSFEVHGGVILVHAIGKYAGRTRMTLGPVFGEKFAERFFVFHGEDRDDGAGMSLRHGEPFAEEGVDLFELNGGLARLFFAGVC